MGVLNNAESRADLRPHNIGAWEIISIIVRSSMTVIIIVKDIVLVTVTT